MSRELAEQFFGVVGEVHRVLVIETKDSITTTEVKIFSVPRSEAIGIELKVIEEIAHQSQGNFDHLPLVDSGGWGSTAETWPDQR